ncbi:hypothetical protein ACE3MZ_23585 [Paenibacillus sp. WLX1005]|uniref:hypothetical protein n=1 Tax=Paenibacillus sp. WLX1005 TaxID=3243766 RepID=UPI003983E417
MIQSSDFLFENIAELDELISNLEQLNKSENKKSMRWFLKYKFELLTFANITYIHERTLQNYDSILFTEKGFIEMTRNKRSEFQMKKDVKISDQEFKEKEAFFIRHVLNKYIIEGIELLYILNRYIEVADKTLHMESDKLGRGIRLFTGKE